jgi:hypothetical protein
MPLYFFLLDAPLFHDRLAPALAASWRQRSFEPCRAVCAELLPAARAFRRRYHTADEPLLGRVADGLPFDRDLWRFLAGEFFLYGATDIPELQTAAETLCWLLAPAHTRQAAVARQDFAPIQQAHFGSHDLVFGGGYYHSAHAGYNDADDVRRLAGFLGSVAADHWTPADLAGLPEVAEADRAEELEFARDCLAELRGLYERAARLGQLVLCEVL